MENCQGCGGSRETLYFSPAGCSHKLCEECISSGETCNYCKQEFKYIGRRRFTFRKFREKKLILALWAANFGIDWIYLYLYFGTEILKNEIGIALFFAACTQVAFSMALYATCEGAFGKKENSEGKTAWFYGLFCRVSGLLFPCILSWAGVSLLDESKEQTIFVGMNLVGTALVPLCLFATGFVLCGLGIVLYETGKKIRLTFLSFLQQDKVFRLKRASGPLTEEDTKLLEIV